MNLVTSPSLYIVTGECTEARCKPFADYREAKSYALTASRVFGLSTFRVFTEHGLVVSAFRQGRQTSVHKQAYE